MTRKQDEPVRSMLPLPLQLLAAWVAVWLGRALPQRIDDLVAENRLLREKLGGRKLQLTDAERRRPALLWGYKRIDGDQRDMASAGRVVRRERLGGLLSFYHRNAAIRDRVE